MKLIPRIQKHLETFYPDFDLEKLGFFNVFLESVDFDEKENYLALIESVLKSLKPLNVDQNVVLAVLVYPFFEKGFLNEENFKKFFKKEMKVLNILRNLKKLNELKYTKDAGKTQLEVVRRMFITMAKDLRVIIIALALKLYEVQHLNHLPDPDQRFLRGREVMDIYVPIAARLGIYRIKTALEDLAFYYVDPTNYRDIHGQIERFGNKKKGAIQIIKRELEDFLKEKGISVDISGRIKSVYSVYKKLKLKNLTLVDELYDIFAIRIVYSDSTEIDKLYGILGMIHSNWKPISHRFKDYIAVPKPNGYRSLHTVVLGLGLRKLNQPVEIQIRNQEMHQESEFGVASHWSYKDPVESQSKWIEVLKDFNDAEGDLDIFSDRIFVLTPNGDVKDLPQGAVPIDFAYSIHTDVGNTCVMAKVNGEAVSLDYPLENGDVVDIITRKNATPKLKWLSVVQSNFAKSKIKSWFSNLDRDKNLKEGKRLFNEQLVKLGKDILDHNYSILKSFDGQDLNLNERETLLEEIGKGAKSSTEIIKKLFPNAKSEPAISPGIQKTGKRKNLYENRKVCSLKDSILVAGEDSFPIKIAACCKPKFGNRIIAYITKGQAVTVHRSDCRIIDSLDGERLLVAKWKGEKEEDIYGTQIDISITVISRMGLFRDISTVISGFGINILDVAIRQGSSGLTYNEFSLELRDPSIFSDLVDQLQKIDGVVKVQRKYLGDSE